MTTASTLIISDPEALIDVLGVIYIHKKTSDGGDIYLTRFGVQSWDILEIENWYEKEWFDANRIALDGTSAVHRLPTKVVNGRSLDLVVKNCRVGEEVPLETRTILQYISAEFNSPWEEFAVTMEMRAGQYGPQDIRLHTQEPLAIYVPPEKMQKWQSGRSNSKINRIKARHPGIDLDILRQYKLVYSWVNGMNAVEALMHAGFSGEGLNEQLRPITTQVIDDMEKKGYVVADMKPDHIILWEADLKSLGPASDHPQNEQAKYIHGLIMQRHYSVIDYELLIRTKPHEDSVRASRRYSYLSNQRDRAIATEVPPHLSSVEILGVKYIYGNAESTGGRLWVVGENARLFDYFLPERWRNAEGWKLSDRNDVFYSHTKDHVHIVWKASRVGEVPPVIPDAPERSRVETFGFNSPFEAFSLADYMNCNGVPTIYMRAIYMTGSRKIEKSRDMSRYGTHKRLLCPDGKPVLQHNHNYITIRGYFNGPDEWVAEQKGKLCRPIDLQRALVNHVLEKTDADRVFDALQQKLEDIGIDGTLLQANDILLSFDPDGNLVKGKDGQLEARVCSFEMLYRK